MSDLSNRKKLLDLYSNTPFLEKIFVHARVKMLPLEKLNEIIFKSGIIIDLGCGHGVISNYLSLMSNNRDVYGLDFDEKRIALARSTIGKRQNIHFETKDITKLDIDKSSTVILFGVLCLVPFHYWDSILEKINKSLSKDGVLLIHEIKKDNTLRYKIHALKEHIFRVIGITKATGLYVMTEDDFVAKINSLGFEYEKIDIDVDGHSTLTYSLTKK